MIDYKEGECVVFFKEVGGTPLTKRWGEEDNEERAKDFYENYLKDFKLEYKLIAKIVGYENKIRNY